ncbi:uncharacterized protein KY384_007642 [Bacidia gigantensis]|uniref:uncharacterized protein n=1 Tax=Bacidia gigantensis TaxID=2732470 RepID=UPI001D040F64|nr:uncharacterized protein KY384_007642 [Bacidia gigantensis]KAG8527490.1 hypothetical protein KY384_007642 [Bacidia gigantensis]
MGMTRAGRYANHKGGRKYAKVNGKKGEGGKEKKVLLEQVEGDWEGRQEKREASTVFRGYWERAKAHPEYVRLKEEFLKGQREQEEPKLADEGRDGKSTGHGERGRKRKRLSNATTITSSFASSLTSLARGTNTMANARLNISAHYDISNAMFAAFLSEDMTYSCPIWAPESSPKSRTESLEDAQHRKLQYFITAAKIKSTDHVLEIGTGWGSFAIEAVKTTGCRVTSLTLSREQKELADNRIAAAGCTENVEVLLCDYRALPMPKEGPYDKVVSIEMLEAVGREYLKTYFNCIHKLLKPEGGIGVFQCITMPEARYEAYAKGEDFIRKYIFPGGHLPTVSQLIGNIEQGSEGALIVDSVFNIGGHYAKTLRLWKEKFERNFDSKIRPALLSEHEGMKSNDVELFRRKWQASLPCRLTERRN